jgi:hypothetical protein
MIPRNEPRGTHFQRHSSGRGGRVLLVAVASAVFSVQTSDVFLEFNGREIDSRFERRLAAVLAIVLGVAGIACIRSGRRQPR